MSTKAEQVQTSTLGPSIPASPKGKGLKKKSSSLPADVVEYLKAWMMSPEHIAHPYPTEQEKAQIMADTGIELKQLTNWFVNNRKRYWKPRVEARLQQQAQAAAAAAQVHAAHAAHAAVMAAATATARANPVTPDSSFKPTLRLQPGNSFVSFDLGSTPARDVTPIPFPRLFEKRDSIGSGSVRLVSEGSSNGSVASSEDSSQTAGEEELTQTESEGPTLIPDDIYKRFEQSSETRQETVETPALKHLLSEQKSLPPRKRFKARSIETWKDVCLSAPTVHDASLPTLEEASLLFGFSQGY